MSYLDSVHLICGLYPVFSYRWTFTSCILAVPFNSIRYSRGAYISLKKKSCRPVLWDKIFWDNMAIIMTHTWNGNSNIDFEKFLAKQRHAWIQCTWFVDYIRCLVTDERSRVVYLLENVSVDFPNIMAAMESIRLDYTKNFPWKNISSYWHRVSCQDWQVRTRTVWRRISLSFNPWMQKSWWEVKKRYSTMA